MSNHNKWTKPTVAVLGTALALTGTVKGIENFNDRADDHEIAMMETLQADMSVAANVITELSRGYEARIPYEDNKTCEFAAGDCAIGTVSENGKSSTLSWLDTEANQVAISANTTFLVDYDGLTSTKSVNIRFDIGESAKQFEPGDILSIDSFEQLIADGAPVSVVTTASSIYPDKNEPEDDRSGVSMESITFDANAENGKYESFTTQIVGWETNGHSLEHTNENLNNFLQQIAEYGQDD